MARKWRAGEMRGFTLVELMVVMLILLLLAGVSTPVVYRSIVQARESTLKATLSTTRRAIDDYYADKTKYPSSLDELVENHYLKAIPYDPELRSSDGWVLIHGDDGGVKDIHSGSPNLAADGTAFNSW